MVCVFCTPDVVDVLGGAVLGTLSRMALLQDGDVWGLLFQRQVGTSCRENNPDLVL